MASAIQLSLPALEVSNSSRFPFPNGFHRCNIYRFNGLHTIPHLLPPGIGWQPYTCVKELTFIRIKLLKIIPTLGCL